MTTPALFHYGEHDLGQLPSLPLRLTYGGTTIVAPAVVDSGASVSVLPFELGTQLGLDWASQRIPLRLSGNFVKHDARAVLLHGTIEPFSPVLLAFAWSQAPGAPLLLGQQNFFMEFDVCFFRSRFKFEVKPKSK